LVEINVVDLLPAHRLHRPPARWRKWLQVYALQGVGRNGEVVAVKKDAGKAEYGAAPIRGCAERAYGPKSLQYMGMVGPGVNTPSFRASCVPGFRRSVSEVITRPQNGRQESGCFAGDG